MAYQSKTYFGIVVPAWPENKMSATKTLTLNFVLQTHFPSLKNKKRIFAERSKAYKIIKETDWNKLNGFQAASKAKEAVNAVNFRIVDTDQWRKFCDEQKLKLHEQMVWYTKKFANKGLIFPLSKAKIIHKFYFKSNYVLDSISKEEATLDLLVKAQIITDDNRYVLQDAVRGARSFKGEIIEDIAHIKLIIEL